MKKNLAMFLATLLFCDIFISCGGEKSVDNANYSNEISDTSGTSDDYGISSTSDISVDKQGSGNEATLLRASIIAQEIVKENFASDCDFDDLDYRGEETVTKGRFKVLQRFTSKRDGVKKDYVYKIYIQFYGGEWEDRKNWDYGQLVVEEQSTGMQWYYKGSMKEKDKIEANNGGKTVNGVEFEVLHTANYDKFISDRRLSKAKLIACAKSIKDQYNEVFFCVSGKVDRGEEYATLTNGLLCLFFDGGDIINLNK